MIRDFSVVILEDCVAAFDEELHLASPRGLGLYLTVMDSAGYLRTLEGSPAGSSSTVSMTLVPPARLRRPAMAGAPGALSPLLDGDLGDDRLAVLLLDGERAFAFLLLAPDPDGNLLDGHSRDRAIHPKRRDPPEREDQGNLGLLVYDVDQRVLAADRYRDLLGGDRGEVVPVTLSPGQQDLGGGLDVTAAVSERRGEEQHPADNANRDRLSHGLAFSLLPGRERRVHTI